ncbi:MAG: pilus assembly protein PilM [Eubacterium sp.]|nr:pilus assembly protein PilM [Eubacterium sp.]
MDWDEYVFGLDIGTRSIVGTVGYRDGADRFIVVAQEVIEHTTRAVIDGQIHDISTVAKTILEIKKRLEERVGQPLEDVSIAAAGRVLKTKQVHVEMDFASETQINDDHIRSLDMMAVEKAYEEIRKDTADLDKSFYCVGYSSVKYYLNDYPMDNLNMHTARQIGVDVIATFLPDEVVDGLYRAVEEAGLRVASLTLEPIAAIQVAIPDKFRLLNIALVDVGAGTSDISIVKDGSIIAFGMIPLAGDEVTETIAKNYLTDFETAESVKRRCERRKSVSFKNIFGDSVKVTKEEIEEISKEAVETITESIAKEIIRLNGGKSVSAVFVVGGGGKQQSFTERLAQYLSLPEGRVAIRGAEVLSDVTFMQEGIKKDSTLVTPIGICLSFYEQNNNFIHVMVNEQRVKLYDNGKATVLDACIRSGFSQKNLFPIRGDELHYRVNGKAYSQKGYMGEVAMVRLNGKEVSLNEYVKDHDEIEIRPSTKGDTPKITIGDIAECKEEISITVFGRKILCPKIIEVNGQESSIYYEIQNEDEIETFDYYSVSRVLEFMGLEPADMVLLNGREAGGSAKVKNGDVIEKIPVKVEPEEEKEETLQEQMEQDPLLQPRKPVPEWMKDILG